MTRWPMRSSVRNGEQVEHDPAGGVHEVEDLDLVPAPGSSMVSSRENSGGKLSMTASKASGPGQTPSPPRPRAGRTWRTGA